MLTYKVYFRIALFPEGVKGHHFEEETDENGLTYSKLIEDTDVFEQYLCSKEQSEFVLSELITVCVYNLIDKNTISELTYEGNGNFYCKIILNEEYWLNTTDDEKEQYIEELLWPGDIHDDAIIFINETHYYLQLDIDYITDWLEESDEDEDEESNKLGDCPYCGENDVEYRCKECDNKICYPCRDRCSNCMETLCPTCNIHEGICTSCLEEEDSEEEESEEEEETQNMYNGVYYHDAMDMEAQMTEDVIKLREAWAKLKNQP